MKVVRCTLHPFQLDAVTDALEAFDIANLTVTGGGVRSGPGVTGVFRGRKYKVRFVPASIVDITASDDQVDDIIRTVTDICSAGGQLAESRIFVMPVQEWYTIRPHHRHIA